VPCEIRPARETDADAISRVIIRALRETNAKDYSPEIIRRLERSFAPAAVRELMKRRRVFVAVVKRRIAGTASLDGKAARAVFVAPDLQGRGIGRLLMDTIERVARELGTKALVVSSSVTAEPFYAKLGYHAVRDNYHGDERTIVMERALGP
jgi:predicted N-acetyltransferase YhbS